jgi:hypothetical protein
MTILIFVIIITLLACHTPHTLTTALWKALLSCDDFVHICMCLILFKPF